jgi:hypothetical protein
MVLEDVDVGNNGARAQVAQDFSLARPRTKLWKMYL